MIEGYEILKKLALDLRWAWNHSTDVLWRTLDPDLWELTHNPWVILQTVSRDRLKQVLFNPEFKQISDSLLKKKLTQEKTATWFQKNHPKALKCIAYFSMEFMLSEALPIYSGGLGNVAGDQLKAAWIGKIRNSMARLTPYYSANRSVREYTESYYIPAALNYKKRTENKAALTYKILEWMGKIKENWNNVGFGSLKIEKQTLEVEVFLGNLKPEWVRVELFANGDIPFEQEMKKIRSSGSSYFYSIELPPQKSIESFTSRIVPYYQTVSVPLEISEIRW